MSNPRRISKNKKEVQDDSIDIDTFKAWLSGVEDMQGDDWTPSAEQWKKIRAKINLLTVPEYEDPKIYPQHPVYRTPGQIGAQTPPIYQPTAPVYQAHQGSALSPTAPIRPQLGENGALPAFQAPGAGSGSNSGLTPVNDMSGAPYESTFG